MINIEHNLGIDGEFQIIVRRNDGSIKIDTGMQKNLLLDNGLKHYLGLPVINSHSKEVEKKDSLTTYCVVGTGNNTPEVTDVSLHNFIAKSDGIVETLSGKEEPNSDKHQGFVKVWLRNKYVFDKINNENITEVGLASFYGREYLNGQYDPESYTLMTRALIKDSGGSPITITVLEGEILEVIYQINMYVDIKRQTGTFTLTTTKDKQDTVDVFEYFLQPYNISNGNYINFPLEYNGYYHGFTTWGVKESDTELNSSYDLNDTIYQSITHLQTDPINQKIKESKTTWDRSYTKYHVNYMTSQETEKSFATLRRSYKLSTGIYSHIYEHGIRAFSLSVGYNSYYSFSGLVVVKNQANGQGIKKTNRQIWEVNFSFTIKRWEV